MPEVNPLLLDRGKSGGYQEDQDGLGDRQSLRGDLDSDYLLAGMAGYHLWGTWQYLFTNWKRSFPIF